jgi:hypothetical protein
MAAEACTHPAAPVRGLAAVGALLLLAGTGAVALLHVLPAERTRDPMMEPISKYAMAPDGWLFDLGVLVLVIGLGVVLWSLVLGRSVAPSSTAVPLMIGCCIGLVAVVIFPDETAGRTFTATGWAHWVAAMLAFGGLPFVPLLIGRHHRRAAGCSPLPGTARVLSYVAAFWFLVLLVGSLMEAVTNVPVWRVGGAVERSLAGTEVATALVLAVWAWRGCGCRRERVVRAEQPERPVPVPTGTL